MDKPGVKKARRPRGRVLTFSTEKREAQRRDGKTPLFRF